MEAELINAELVLPTHFSFKRMQIYEKYSKGQPSGRWKHLKQILQAENYQNCPPEELNCNLCQKTISTQELKFLGEVPEYNLYYSLTYTLKWKHFKFETCTSPHYLVLNFYQINRDGEIRTRDRLVIKALIPYQKIILTQ